MISMPILKLFFPLEEILDFPYDISSIFGGSSMKDYAVERTRNIALIGHGSSGKTTLTSAFLFKAE
jgi:type IV secretory pathway ATPase VirB11/archaellum biosynthesis ATPase